MAAQASRARMRAHGDVAVSGRARRGGLLAGERLLEAVGQVGEWRMTRAECVAPSQRRRNAPTSSPSQMMRSLSTGAPESLSDVSPPLLRLLRP